MDSRISGRHLPLAILVGTSCVASARGHAQADVEQVVGDALAVKVETPGGCIYGRPDPVPYELTFFPGVTFFRVTCRAEHGQELGVVVGADDDVVYTLDSPSSFALMVRRHPVVGLDSTTALEYTANLLVMVGKTSPVDTVIGGRSALRATVLNQLSNRQLSQLAPQVAVVRGLSMNGRPGQSTLYQVSVSVLSVGDLRRFSVTIDPSGRPFAVLESWRLQFNEPVEQRLRRTQRSVTQPHPTVAGIVIRSF